MYLYYTSDEADTLTLSEEERALMPHLGGYSAMLLRRNFELAAGLIEDSLYEYPTAELIAELIETSDRYHIDSMVLDEIIKSPECQTICVNVAAFPDSVSEIPYDEILGAFTGALHGAHTMLTEMREHGYWSPGQVLDVHQYLQFSGMDHTEIGFKPVRDLYKQYQRFFESAARRQEAVFFRPTGF